MDDTQRKINQQAIEVVEKFFISSDPFLESSAYRRIMTPDAKKSLIRQMCNMAIQMGAVPVKPIEI